MASLIGVTGGKGGTGKSTIATAIAFRLAQTNRVLLVDADVDCPNDHLLLSIEKELVKEVFQRLPKIDSSKCLMCGRCGQVCRKNALVSIIGKRPILLKEQCNGCGACSLKCPNGAISWSRKRIGRVFSGRDHGLTLLSGELEENEPASEFVVNELNRLIEESKADFDNIIIDTAAGTHCPVIAALEACNRVICVTEPTPLGAHDLQIILSLLKKLKLNPLIVVNRSDAGDMKLIEDLFCKRKQKQIIKIPHSRQIINQYSKGIPIQGEFAEEIIKRL
jgi:MinD superfamily P-loop ATPase